MVGTSSHERGKTEAAPGRLIVRMVILATLFGLALFGLAGRLDWLAGWLFWAGYVGYMVGASLWTYHHDPDLLWERSRSYSQQVGAGQKVLLALMMVVILKGLGVAALDAGRYAFSAVPLAVQIAGWLGLLAGLGCMVWALATNTYASTVVRIQTERHQTVITTGPYRYVRHPMYVGLLLFAASTPLALGSYLALIPGGVLAALVVIRTVIEDRLLRRDLPGYAEYAQRVRYRLLPGVW
jgi:protein-S-isoprenylcysteine O-methyltransferase Ste14